MSPIRPANQLQMDANPGKPMKNIAEVTLSVFKSYQWAWKTTKNIILQLTSMQLVCLVFFKCVDVLLNENAHKLSLFSAFSMLCSVCKSQAVTVALQIKFSPESKISGNLGSTTKMSKRVLWTSRKKATGFLVKRFEEWCEVRCWLSSVTGREVTVFLTFLHKSPTFTLGVGLRQGYVLSQLLFITWIG